MTVIEPTITLGDLVTAHPELARELEHRGLDYCCGGTSTLDEACTRAGLDASTVARELSTVADPPSVPDWATLGLVGLVDHLLDTHHRYLWDELPRLGALVDKILGVHGVRHPELEQVAKLFTELRADLEPHLLNEERVLFPMVRDLAVAEQMPDFHCGSLDNPISVMLTEHDVVGDLLARMREVTGGYRVPDDGCASYRACYAGLEQLEADTHQHVHKENNRLFPMVRDLERRLCAA